jgi:DNA-binding transcriptional MerR regulator
MTDSKLYYSISEVCQMIGLKDSVLRYWESEIPKMRPKQNRSSGKRMYTKKDIELILHVKHLLHEEKLSIKDAKARIGEERKAGNEAKASGRITRLIPKVATEDEPLPKQDESPEPEAQTSLFDDQPANQPNPASSSPISNAMIAEIRNELTEILAMLEP